MIVARIYKMKSFSWIWSKNAMQFFSSILVTIAVNATKSTTVDVDNILA